MEVSSIEKIAFNSSTPLYIQVYNAIMNEIKSGKYVNGDQLPSENDLCDFYAVSRITIRKAVEELEERGIVEKRRGKGTFVAYPQVMEEVLAGGSFTKSSQLVNTTPSTKAVFSKKVAVKDLASKRIATLFAQQENVIYIERVRYIDAVPMIFETDYFFGHHDFILAADLENTPLMETIRAKTGLQASYFEDKFDVIISDKKIEAYLDCAPSSPLLHVEQKVLTENGELIYYNEQIIRQDLYKYVIQSEKQ